MPRFVAPFACLIATFALTACAVDANEEAGYDTIAAALGQAEYGPAKWVYSPNFYNSSRKIGQVKVIVIHTTQGSYAGAVSWQQNPKAKVSAHYTMSKNGDVTQMVKEEDIAWHVGSENGYTIGIEHEGFVADPGWVTPKMLEESSKLTCHLLKKWKLPADKAHVKGHVEMPNQTHTDPGKYWPWDKYMGMVKACVDGTPPPPPPPLPPPPTKAGCCTAKAPTSGSLVIDDAGNDCIQLLGPAKSWWTTPASGTGGSMHYTYTSAKPDVENYARWRLTFAKAGKYKVEVWVPSKFATAKPSYKVKHAGQVSSKVVDQKPLSNVWVDLGTHDFAADCDEYVVVGDNTGQPYDKTVTLGIDAVRVTAVDQCPGGCSDNNACTDDSCVANACVHANNSAGCDDGNGCTVGDKCAAGKCSGAGKDCDDKNACTNDGCAGGACNHAANAAGCDDGNACTSGDVCSGGNCAAGQAKNCDDQNECTVDACAGGNCSHKNGNGPCGGGDACVTGGQCSGGQCAGGKPVDCADGNPCTIDKCGLGKCSHMPSGGACDDGNSCTTGDACQGGACWPGALVACDDNNPCTDDACLGGACIHSDNAGYCDDADSCTQGDHCAGGKCTALNSKSCEDGNACTADSCSGGACQHAPVDGGCDDGEACTEKDTCAEGACAGKAMDCDDQADCTEDTCKGGICLHSGGQPATRVCKGDTVWQQDPCGGESKVIQVCKGESACVKGDCKTGVGGGTAEDAAVSSGDVSGASGDAPRAGDPAGKADGSVLNGDLGSGANLAAASQSPAPSSGCGAARAQGSSGWLAFLSLVGAWAWTRRRVRQGEAAIG